MKCITTKFVLCVIIVVLTYEQGFSQTSLSPGDIAFIGFNSDNPDAFTFIVLSTIPANTTINFTDNGWESNNTLTTNEGHIIWTAPSGGLLLGDIISLNYENGWYCSSGTVVQGGGNLSLSAEGDQILAYQVQNDTTFIAAIHFDGNGWNIDANTSNESALPSGLENNITAIAIPEDNNGIFVGKLSGSKTVLLAKINNPDHWFSSSTYSFQLTSDDYPYNVWVSTNTEWNDANRWFTDMVPDIYDHAYIKGTRDPYISSTTHAVCKKITLAENSSLTIKSDASGTGSLICPTADIGSGVILNVERYINSANWHLVSSPVTGQGLDAFGAAAGNSIVLFTGATPNEYNLSSYNESDDTWSFVPVGGTGDFTEGLGYSMQRSAAGVVTFSGTGLTMGTKVVNIAGSTDRGWNLIGNPYTAPIDAATFLTANATTNLDPSFQFVYLWDQSKNDYTQTTTGNIALGQGFFVNSKDGGGTVSFTTAMQSTAAATFKSDEIPWPLIKLMARGQELYNETSLSFNSEMSLGLDPGFDGGKLRGNPDIALYTKLVEDNGVDFAVQALPAITQEVFSIPVGLDFEPGGEITFSLETNYMPEGALVYLEDVAEGTITQLNLENAVYTVNLDEGIRGTGRFNLLVSKSGSTGTEIEKENKAYQVYTQDKTIVIDGPASNKTNFTLYSIDGKMWVSQYAVDFSKNKVDAQAFPAGIYILKINNEGRLQTQKIVLSK